MENEKIEKTYEDLLEFIECKNKVKKGNTKFDYAANRIIDRIASATKKINKDYDKKQRDLIVDFASEDAEKNLIVSDKGLYSYTKENQKKLDSAIEKLQDERLLKKVEIEPYIVSDYPELTERQEKAFEGLLIPLKEKQDEQKM